MHRRRQTRPLVALMFVSLAGAHTACDPQVSPFYRGESLFTLAGSVEITANRTPGPLVPALAFANGATNDILIVDAEVQGKFPSDFRLDVYDAPPAAALMSTSEVFVSDEKIALGYVTAVPEHHRASIRFADSESTSAAACPSSGCSDAPQTAMASWCTSHGTIECYSETSQCPGADTSSPDCHVTAHQGDPALKDPWRAFAGFSQNYMVLYLPVAAPVGSYLASVFGGGSELARGYHLLELNNLSSDEYQATQACVGNALDSVVARYNAEHMTQYTTDEAQGGCTMGGLCAMPEAERQAVVKQLGQSAQRRQAELGCWQIAPPFTLVADPEHTSISVRIGAEPPPQYGQPSDAEPPQP